MESTGQPGRIQISEAVQKKIIVIKDQPFGFDAKHRVSCRGFGQVTAYFVSHCNIPPPRTLLESLRIKPHLGRFAFENPLPHLRGANPSSTRSSSNPNGSDAHSSKASVASGSKIRKEPELGPGTTGAPPPAY